MNGLAERIGARFFRREQRDHAGRYLQGLIGRIERKNSWQHWAVGLNRRQCGNTYLKFRMTLGIACLAGQREYDWAFLDLAHYEQKTHARGCLVRRSLDEPSEHAFYYTHAPRGSSLEKLVQVAGSRWAIEECFEQAKQETGLVRSWLGWRRHITLSMLAHAALAAVRVQASKPAAQKKSGSSFP